MFYDEDILYHYTSVQSVHSILQSKSIWATDYRYLNDKNELEDAIDNLLNIVDESQKKDLKSAFYLHLQHHVYTVFSLSESPKVLSQWRAYANDGQGMALGFSKSFFDSFVASNDATNSTLVRCIYTDHISALKNILSEYKDDINSIIEIMLQNMAKNDQLTQLRKNPKLFHGIILKLFTIKNSAFSEEREVRYISYQKTIDSKTRVNNELIIPFKEIRLYLPDDKECFNVVLNNIYLGPKCDERNRYSLERVLNLNIETIPIHRYSCGYQ